MRYIYFWCAVWEVKCCYRYLALNLSFFTCMCAHVCTGVHMPMYSIVSFSAGGYVIWKVLAEIGLRSVQQCAIFISGSYADCIFSSVSFIYGFALQAIIIVWSFTAGYNAAAWKDTVCNFFKFGASCSSNFYMQCSQKVAAAVSFCILCGIGITVGICKHILLFFVYFLFFLQKLSHCFDSLDCISRVCMKCGIILLMLCA